LTLKYTNLENVRFALLHPFLLQKVRIVALQQRHSVTDIKKTNQTISQTLNRNGHFPSLTSILIYNIWVSLQPLLFFINASFHYSTICMTYY